MMIVHMEVAKSRALGSSRAESLYREHAPGAVGLAFLLTGDRHVAEDLTQDAFVRMFGRFRDLRDPNAFPLYLRRTIINLSKDHFRRSRGPHADISEVNVSEMAPYDRIDEGDRILTALQALPHRQRTAVVLRHCEGFSEAEAADLMNTSTGAINSLVSRAVGRLREILAGADP